MPDTKARGDRQTEGDYPADEFGIGVLNDGELNVVTEEEAFRRGQLRDAMEGDEMPDEEDDLADLAGIEEMFGA